MIFHTTAKCSAVHWQLDSFFIALVFCIGWWLWLVIKGEDRSVCKQQSSTNSLEATIETVVAIERCHVQHGNGVAKTPAHI